MILMDLVNRFSYHDIEDLIAFHCPKEVDNLPVYLHAFFEIDTLLSEGLMPNTELAMDIKLVRCRVNQGGNVSFGAYILNSYGWPCLRVKMVKWLSSEIDYMTMEMFSDEEIFIRCLVAIVEHNYKSEKCDELISEYEEKHGAKKKIKDIRKKNQN
jgi:hypothetical protein